MSPDVSAMPLSRMAKATTTAAPATPHSQNRVDGRSPPISAAKTLVARGRMPSTTPPCEAGTVCMAIDERMGNAKTRSTPAASNPARWGFGNGFLSTRSRMPAARLATVARPTVTNQGLKDSSASRVNGKVPPKITTPSNPSASPMVSREILLSSLASAGWDMQKGLEPALPQVPKIRLGQKATAASPAMP